VYQEPLVTAAGTKRTCEVPIRTLPSSFVLLFPVSLATAIAVICPFTPSVYSNQVQTGKNAQLNENLGSLLDFLIRSV
jgi:hypothetical protein